MSKKNDGGPAFPGENSGHPGMSLRDYFAAKAMQGAITHGLFNCDKANADYAAYLASVAYIYADAMLEARDE